MWVSIMSSKTISGVIYGLYINLRWYVGLSRNLDKTGYPRTRTTTHKRDSRKGSKFPVHLAISKYGFPEPVILERITVDVSNYDEEFVEMLNEEMAQQEENMNDDDGETVIMEGDEAGPLKELIEKLNEAECKWIKDKNSMVSWKGGNGYNVQPGGGSFDHIISEELVKKREDKQVEIVQKYIDFKNKNNREPCKTDGELYLCHKHWLATVKGLGAHLLYPKAKKLLDTAFPGWSDTLEDKQHQKVTLLHRFFVEKGRLPSVYRQRGEDKRSDIQRAENDLAEYLHKFKFARQRKLGIRTKVSNKLFDSTEKMLDELIPGWYKSMNEIAIENCEKIIEYHKENGCFPGCTREKSVLGNVYHHFRNMIISKNSKSKPYDTIANMLDSYDIKWRSTNKSKQDELVDTIIEFINEKNRLPKCYSEPKNDDEKYEQSLGRKIVGFRFYLKNGSGNQTITDENRKRLDDALPGWLNYVSKRKT
jgi:hypothetical protein